MSSTEVTSRFKAVEGIECQIRIAKISIREVHVPTVRRAYGSLWPIIRNGLARFEYRIPVLETCIGTVVVICVQMLGTLSREPTSSASLFPDLASLLLSMQRLSRS